MSDDEMPAQPATKMLPAADRTEIQFNELKVLILTSIADLDGKVAVGLRDMGKKIDRIEANIDRVEANIELQGGEIGIVKKEVGLLFRWKDDVDVRLTNNSMRAQSSSQIDLEQASQLHQEREARESLAGRVEVVDKKVDKLTVSHEELASSNEVQLTILKRIDAITQKPAVKLLGAAIFAYLLGWLGSKGIRVTP